MHRTKRIGLIGLLFVTACTHLTEQAAPPAPVMSSGAEATASGAVAPPQEAAKPLAKQAVATPVIVQPPQRQTRKPAPAAQATALVVPPAKPSPGEERTAPAADSKRVDKPAVALGMDLASLEQRLRDTHAIGVFTKLSLKNQVDDLLDSFRAYYGGRSNTTLAALRQRYDLLLMKVLTVVQDGDPPLATAIAASRNALWGILADREKFQKI